MPDTSVEIFNERISDILNTIQKDKKHSIKLEILI